jgi:hypothetical protein
MLGFARLEGNGKAIKLSVVESWPAATCCQRFGFQRKYTGTPSRTMIRPGHVVAVR